MPLKRTRESKCLRNVRARFWTAISFVSRWRYSVDRDLSTKADISPGRPIRNYETTARYASDSRTIRGACASCIFTGKGANLSGRSNQRRTTWFRGVRATYNIMRELSRGPCDLKVKVSAFNEIDGKSSLRSCEIKSPAIIARNSSGMRIRRAHTCGCHVQLILAS